MEKGYVTANRTVLGCADARSCGLLDGDGEDIIIRKIADKENRRIIIAPIGTVEG